MGVFQNNLMGAAAAAASAGGDFYTHQIANSCRFDGSTSQLDRTPSSAGNRRTFTFSTWIKKVKNGVQQCFFSAGSGTYSDFEFDSSDRLSGHLVNGGTSFQSTALFRDLSAWYHFVVIMDTTQSTADDRCKVYINGERITAWNTDPASTISQNYDWDFNNNVKHAIGYEHTGRRYFAGYLADTYMVDGTAKAIGDCGTTKNGVWIPDNPSGFTFGTNGFLVDYASSSDLGNDVSGNNNDFNASAGLSAHDQMLDSPTFNSDSNGGNFATLGPLWKTPDMTFSEGNLKWTTSSNQRGAMSNWSIPLEDKYYFEYVPLSWGYTSGDDMWLGLNVSTVDFTASRGGKATCYGYGANSGKKIDGDGTEDSYGASWGTNDIIGVAVDRVNDTIQFSKNGSFQGSAFAIPSTADLFPWVGSGGGFNSASGVFNFGQDGTFAGNVTAGGNSDATGYGNFKYAVPSGFKALCQGNLPVADAVDPAQTDDDYPQKLFDAIIYTGTGSEKDVAVGWQPDLTWVKERGGVNDNKLTDSVRGATKALESNTNAAETTDAQGVKAFTSTGFTLGTDAVYNNNTDTYVAWNWKEGADYGLDIVTYSGTLTGSGVVNISHSLGAIPECLWHMCRTGNGGAIRHKDLTDANYIMSNQNTMSGSSGTGWGTSAQGSKSGNGNMTALGTSSTFTTNYTGLLNENGNTYVAYVWRGIEGFSKFGSYEGNGDTDGPFIYTGFRPALVINKRIDGNGSYLMHDDARNTFNVTDLILTANDGGAEFSGPNDKIDMLANGFKLRSSNAGINGTGNDYIYMAWAKNPFKYATAR